MKRRGKSPPGASAKAASHGKPLPQQDQIGDDAVARGAINPGFWSHRQMIAASVRGEHRIRLTAAGASLLPGAVPEGRRRTGSYVFRFG